MVSHGVEGVNRESGQHEQHVAREGDAEDAVVRGHLVNQVVFPGENAQDEEGIVIRAIKHAERVTYLEHRLPKYIKKYPCKYGDADVQQHQSLFVDAEKKQGNIEDG